LSSIFVNDISANKKILIPSNYSLIFFYLFQYNSNFKKPSFEFFVRKSYVELFKMIMEEDQDCYLITGSPGIGKSLFFFYFVIRTILENINNNFLFLVILF
jgi:hypothetical protein